MVFFFNDTATTEIYTLSLHDALPILVTLASLLVAGVLTFGVITVLSWVQGYRLSLPGVAGLIVAIGITADSFIVYFERSEEHTSELQSRQYLVCRLLLEKKNIDLRTA